MRIPAGRQRTRRQASVGAAALLRRAKRQPGRPWLVPGDQASETAAVLEAEAHAVVRLLEATPPTWASAGFAASVESIRTQLGPIRSREALASSRSREGHAQPGSSCGSRSAADRLADCPVEVAYALRWIELGEGPVPAWTELLHLLAGVASARSTAASMTPSDPAGREPVGGEPVGGEPVGGGDPALELTRPAVTMSPA